MAMPAHELRPNDHLTHAQAPDWSDPAVQFQGEGFVHQGPFVEGWCQCTAPGNTS